MRTILVMILAGAPTAMAQDADFDGVLDANDNCLGISNPLQEDSTPDPFGDACVAPTATVASDMVLAAGALIQPLANVGTGVSIGENAVVGRSANVGANGGYGADVILGRSTVIGANAAISNGVSIGYASTAGTHFTAGESVVIGSLVQVGNDVQIGALSAIARSVQLGNGAVVGNRVVVGPNVVVAANAHLGTDVRVRKDASIEAGAMVGQGARVGRDVVIGTGAIVGANVTLRTGAIVTTGSVVPDNTVVARGVTFGAGEVCTDGVDNNNNGLIDCEDVACLAEPTCAESSCDDGMDNDSDGNVDCADDDCIGVPGCQLTIVHRSNVISIREIRSEQSSYIYDNDWQSYSGASGTCANLSSALVTGPASSLILRDRRIEVRSVFGDVRRQVGVDSYGQPTTAECRWDVANATFTGSGSVLSLVSRTGVVVEPGCGVTADSFLPTQLTLDVGPGPSNNSGYGSSSSSSSNHLGPGVRWQGEDWYLSADQQYDRDATRLPLPYGADEPIGDCGDNITPYGSENRSVFWGPDCDCEGRILRSGNELHWSFSGATAPVVRQAP